MRLKHWPEWPLHAAIAMLAMLVAVLIIENSDAQDLDASDLAVFAPTQLAAADLALFAEPAETKHELSKAELSLFACDCGNCETEASAEDDPLRFSFRGERPNYGQPITRSDSAPIVSAALNTAPAKKDSAYYRVKVYSPETWACPHCDRLKDSLRAADVRFTEVAQEQGPVPRTVVSLEYTIVGNYPAKILRLLGKDAAIVTQMDPVGESLLVETRETLAPVVTEYTRGVRAGRQGFFARVGQAIFGRRQSRVQSVAPSSGYYGGACETCQ